MSPGTAGTAAVPASTVSTCGAEYTDKAWLADELGAALVQLSMVLRRAILPPQIGLTQATTLLILRDEGPERVTRLAEAAQVTQPTMSALVIVWSDSAGCAATRAAPTGVPLPSA